MRYCKKLIAFGFVAAVASVSFCANGDECKKLRVRPIDESGKALDSYCVVPLYSKESGVRVGPEMQGGTHNPAWYLIFVAEKAIDQDLACLKEKGGSGIIGIPFTPLLFEFGETVYPGMPTLFLKRGYLPFTWNQYHGSSSVGEFVMRVGDSEELVQHLLSGQIDQERMREIFRLRPEEKVVDELNSEEKEKLRRCYYGE